MKLFFRVDSGTAIGGGHLARCLTLAIALRAHLSSASIHFVTRDHAGSQHDQVVRAGFKLHRLSVHGNVDYVSGGYSSWVGADTKCDLNETQRILKSENATSNDWLIVDHYGLNVSWESKISCRVGVIDDLVNREHAASFLLDQTVGRVAAEYDDLVNSGCKVLCGADYCLLRPIFSLLKAESLRRKSVPRANSILMNFGSSDPHNFTSSALIGVEKFAKENDASVVVFVGSSCPHIKEIEGRVARANFNTVLHVDTDNVAELMLEASLAIGAAGSTTWERCAMGLPSVLVKTAENQLDVIEKVCSNRAALYYSGELSDDGLSLMLDEIMANYSSIRDAASKLVDGKGVDRMVNFMVSEVSL